MEIYSYDKDDIKNNLITTEQIFDLLGELGGEPMQVKDDIICKTICHGGSSHKLYYYSNTKLFKCYTDCADTFDIFELVRKVKTLEIGNDFSLPAAIKFVADYFGIAPNNVETGYELSNLEDFKRFVYYDRLKSIDITTKKAELTEYDARYYNNLPSPHINEWEWQGINREVIHSAGIRFNPLRYSIIIPHYDINDRLIGIRERTLIKDNEIYGKYRPAILHGQMYNHPLGFNLYNINKAKTPIKILKKAILFEGEKSPLLYGSIYGEENNIAVACCGSSFINYQFYLLQSLGVEEIIIGFDRQYQEIGDKEFKKLTANLENIQKKYGSLVKISFLFDKTCELLGYKDSPIDKGKEIFEELMANRITLYK